MNTSHNSGLSSPDRFPWNDQFFRKVTKRTSSLQSSLSSGNYNTGEGSSCTSSNAGQSEGSNSSSLEVLSLWMDIENEEDMFPSGGLLTRIFPERKCEKPVLETTGASSIGAGTGFDLATDKVEDWVLDSTSAGTGVGLENDNVEDWVRQVISGLEAKESSQK